MPVLHTYINMHRRERERIAIPVLHTYINMHRRERERENCYTCVAHIYQHAEERERISMPVLHTYIYVHGDWCVHWGPQGMRENHRSVALHGEAISG